MHAYQRSFMCGIAALLLPSMVSAQDSLPFPSQPSPSTAGRTIAESVYKDAAPVRRLPAAAPNVVVIMMDDVGPALPDTFGGPIRTPTLTRIANSGITYNRFHNAAMC